VTAGQTLIQVDHEKQQYSLEQQKATLARALAQYGAADPQHLPDVEKTPDVQKASADLVQAKQSFDRTSELFKRSLVPKQLLDDAAAALQSKQASYDLSLQTAKNLRASIQGSEASMKLADRPASRYRDSARRSTATSRSARQPRRAREDADAGDGGRPRRSAEVIAEIPEKMAPWIKDGQPVELHVDAYPDRRSSARCRASARRSTPRPARFRSRRWCRTRTRG
jgi:multidrug resistance efflux pump